MKNTPLKILRKVHGETQELAAKSLGMSLSALRKKENEETELTRSELKSIIAKYNLSKDEFWKFFFADEVHAKRI